MNEVGQGHVFVMAGGSGTRLHPLTAARCKPALPFGATHRVVDFVVSNLLNSGLRSIDVLLQYRPQELILHLEHERRSRVRMRLSRPGQPYLGTADAVRQNFHVARASGARWVGVFGADHVYRMDVQPMVTRHLESGADVSIAVLPVPLNKVREFGIVEIDACQRVGAFHEKPAQAIATSAHPGHAMASMGNYVFSTKVLGDALERAHAVGATDFGQHVLPELLRTHEVLAYDFGQSRTPGGLPGADATTPRYWRDIGTLDAYFDAQMDTLGPQPAFALDDPAWPLRSALAAPPPQLDSRAEVNNSSLGGLTKIDEAMLDHVVAREEVVVARHAQVDHAVLMAGTHVGAGARLRRVIVDEGNAIPPGEVIGFDDKRDRERFPVSAEGVVVIPRNHFADPRRTWSVKPPAPSFTTRFLQAEA